MSTDEKRDYEEHEEQKDRGDGKTYIVLRENIYLNVTEDFLKTGLYLDGDIIEMNRNGDYKMMSSCRHRFLADSNFFGFSDTVGSLKYDDKSVEVLQKHFIENGKLPLYLGFKNKDGIVRIIAKKKISANTFLGNFEGIPRPIGDYPWSVPVKGFNREDVYVLDADNITFSNWTRYLLIPQLSPQTPQSTQTPQLKSNCILSNINYSVMVFSTSDIEEGDELCI